MKTEPQPASITAAFKCWHVNSGEYAKDNRSPSWGVATNTRFAGLLNGEPIK